MGLKRTPSEGRRGLKSAAALHVKDSIGSRAEAEAAARNRERLQAARVAAPQRRNWRRVKRKG